MRWFSVKLNSPEGGEPIGPLATTPAPTTFSVVLHGTTPLPQITRFAPCHFPFLCHPGQRGRDYGMKCSTGAISH